MMMLVNLNMVSETDSQSAITGLPFSPITLSAKAKSMLKTTICSTSPSAMALITDSGKMWRTKSCQVCGAASFVDGACGGSTTPTPGRVRFTSKRPMAMASVVTTSK